MRPLLILIPFVITLATGKPGSYNYPIPTPSTVPAPSIFDLQALAAQPSPAPSIINLPSPSIAPSLLVENVPGAGQYGPPPVNAQPLDLQFSGQPLGIPFSVGLPQSQIQFSGPSFGFAQPGVNLGAQIPLSQLSIEPPRLPVGPPPPPFNVGAILPRPVNQQVPHVHNTGGVVVQKHVYVFVAPEDPEERAPPRHIVLPPARKNYRVIFIKAPTAPAPKVTLVAPQVQDEDKTLVYVLVKKQEEQPEIKIEAPSPTVSSKPEVYFIRYKSQQGVSNGAHQPESSPLPIESKNGAVSIFEDGDKSDDPTVPTVRIGGPSEHKEVDLNLNKASLDGGSALSLAVTNIPEDAEFLSTPPPEYDNKI